MYERTTDKIERIRELNDQLRTTLGGGTIVMTDSVRALPETVRAQAIVLMSKFNEFTEDNDPHGEHDFGNFEFCGRRWLWKIDYYDKSMQYGSSEPADPEQTARVLTLMLAEDY
jgi:hypothetical protein